MRQHVVDHNRRLWVVERQNQAVVCVFLAAFTARL